LNRVLAPESEVLSFAPPKESTQRKGGPDAAYTLRSSLSTRVDRRAVLGPLPTRRIHATPLRANLAESSGARRGKREQNPVAGLTVVQYFVFGKNWLVSRISPTSGGASIANDALHVVQRILSG